MFEDTRTQQDPSTNQRQDQERNKLQQEAQRRTEETKELLRAAEARMYGSTSQGIDGRVQEVVKTEQAGASAAKVAEKTLEGLAGSIEHDIKRHTGLNVPLLERRDEELLDLIRREVMMRAEPIEARERSEKRGKQGDGEKAKELGLKEKQEGVLLSTE